MKPMVSDMAPIFAGVRNKYDSIKEREYHDAVSEGRAACHLGLRDNPYPQGTSEHRGWQTGCFQERRDFPLDIPHVS
jgi:hypothetical protein